MSNRAWMPLHIDIYLADTGHLSTLEHGAYFLLIMHYWRNGGLPADERMISRIARLTAEQWAESRDMLKAMFRDGWKHKRIDEELAKADDIIEKRRAAAIGRHTKNKPSAQAEQMQSICTDTGGNTLNLEPTEKEEPTGSFKKRGERIPEDFKPDIGWAQAQGISFSEATIEAAQFLDWWRSKAGKDGAKLDWPGTWRVWIRNFIKRRRSTAPPRQTGVSGAAQRIIESESNGSESIFGSHGDAQRIPAASISGSRNAAPDLPGGIGRQFISIDH